MVLIYKVHSLIKVRSLRMSSRKAKSRIFWSDVEVEKIIEEALRLYFAEEKIAGYIADGQKVLPQDRQRTINSQSVGKKFLGIFKQKRDEAIFKDLPSEIQIEIPVPKEVLVERPLAETLERVTTEELLIVLSKRLAPVIDRFNTVIHKIEKPNEHHDNHAKKPVENNEQVTSLTNSKTKVLLYGFLEGQKNDIISRSSNFNLDIIFRTKDQGISNPLPSCNYCIVLRMVSHADWNKLKGTFAQKGKGHICYVKGVNDTLKNLAKINSLVAMK